MLIMSPYCKDYDAYNRLPESDRWIFNKLEICIRFGYEGGPCGIPMKIGKYCIRPIINLNGMAEGGFWKRVITKTNTIIIKPGYIWTKWETGPRSWVEYVNDKISSAQIAINFNEKTGIETYMELPAKQAQPIPQQLMNISRYMLVEYLGDVVIDIGPRHMYEETKQSIVNDYRNFDSSYNPPNSSTFAFQPYMKRVQDKVTKAYTWIEVEKWIPRKIY